MFTYLFILLVLFFILLNVYNVCNNNIQISSCNLQSQDLVGNCIDYEKTIRTEKDKQAILNKINSRRDKVAFGEIKSFPLASNMMKLEWSENLGVLAQKWADQCIGDKISGRDSCLDLENVGQNIATIYGVAPGLTPSVLVDLWYIELLNINSSIIADYRPSSETNLSHYDYFTQLVWAESNYVGCGSVKFKEARSGINNTSRTVNRLVCNFLPPGNRHHLPVYSVGVPCSLCPQGSIRDIEHKALCKRELAKEIKDIEDISHTNDSQEKHVKSTPLRLELKKPTPDSDEEIFTPYDYFTHFFQYTSQAITSSTENNKPCKDVLAVDDFVELLKKRLSTDPMFKELLSPKTNTLTSDNTYADANVAAFVSRLYSKKEPSTTTKSLENDFINSTLLVDLVEAVIFRSGDTLSSTAESESSVAYIANVNPIKIQAELSEVKVNHDFTGHYFFPEDDVQENNTETTETYEDMSNLPLADVVLEIEEIKRQKTTKDFLDDILESESSREKDVNIRNKRQNNDNKELKYTEPIQLKQSRKHRRSIIKHDSSFYVKYSKLLRRIASDLRVLKLNERFHCCQSYSPACLFTIPLIFLTVLVI